ncbi:MFS transporter [Streptomyces coeruleorubidus]|uniref:MFS transporter n=1 Tax=Streptomyces coeruleorubidus TaxID=116188 RepID=UPI0033A7C6B0
MATTSKIQATAHLLTARHRRVLFLGGTPGFSSADERRLGHQNALRAHGIPYAEELDTSGDCTRKSGYLHTREALRTGVEFTAVFPGNSPAMSLIGAVLTYAVGFVVRPLSGIIISPLADRYGRRVVLATTIGGMAAGSLILALTPPFSAIGYAAPLLFLFARVLQGISAGSEMQSAIAYMVENGSTDRRGLFGSLSNVASGLATLAATGMGAIVTSTLNTHDLETWGWAAAVSRRPGARPCAVRACAAPCPPTGGSPARTTSRAAG